MMCAEPGMMPMMKPSSVPRAIGIAGLAPFLPVRQQLAQLRRDHLADRRCVLGVDRISPSPNSPTATGTMPMPSPSSARSKL